MEDSMNTENKTMIRISVDKANQLTVDAQGVMLPNAIQLCLAGIEAMCKQTLSRADDVLKPALEEDMYEMINMGASTLLARLFPEIEMRPDVTVDALMQAEDEVFNKDPEKYAKAYAESAQAKKDVYEHNTVKAQLAKQAKKK
jgi:hypothetical protein